MMMMGSHVWQCETLALRLPFKPLTVFVHDESGGLLGKPQLGLCMGALPLFKLDFSEMV